MSLGPPRIARRTTPSQAAHQILVWALFLGLLLGLWETAMLSTWGLYRPAGWAAQGVLLLLLASLHALPILIGSLGLHVLLWWRRRAVDRRDFRTSLPLKLLPALLMAIVIVDTYGLAHASGRMSGLISSTTPRRNLLLVTLDTLRMDQLGCYGNAQARTPNLDRLSRDGTLFTDATCPVPMTTPSHASMLVGTIPAQHGARENAYRLGPENVSLAERLRMHGYRTAAFVSAYTLNRRFGLDQGFELYADRFVPATAWHESLWGRILDRLLRGRAIERRAEETNRAAIPWLRAHADESFFLWVHYFDPHAPYVPPPPYDRLFEPQLPRGIPSPDNAREHVLRASQPPPGREADLSWPLAAYMGEVAYLDAQVGVLLGELDRLELGESTLVVVAADHGESLGERGYFYSHGRTLYQNEMEIPLLIRQPGAPPRLEPGLADLTDLAPEVMALLGLPWSERLIPQEEPSAAEPHRRLGSASFALIENRGIVLDPEAVKTRGVRSGSWKYIQPQASSRASQLYDLARDPAETRSVAGEHPDLVRTLREVLEDGFAQAEGLGVRGEVLLDEETLEAMESLGYLGGPGEGAP